MPRRAAIEPSDVVENYLKAIHALALRACQPGPGGGVRASGARTGSGRWTEDLPPRGAGRGGGRGVARGAGTGLTRGARRGGGAVPLVLTGELAAALGLTPGSVTSMVKRLSARGLVRYERYGGVSLTRAGESAALAVLRRHRIVETFLVRVLGLDWSEVHDEAERIEHVLSDRVVEALDRLLGHPQVDPHGDPIPQAVAGSAVPVRRSADRTDAPSARTRRGAASSVIPLCDCAPGTSATIDRVLDQSRGFLQFAAAHGLQPGAGVRVLAPGASQGIVRVSVGRRGISLGRQVASSVLVSPEGARRRAAPPRRSG